MKRLRSSDDLDSYCGKTAAGKEPASSDRSGSSSHRSFHHKKNFERKGPISPSRYDRDRPPYLAGDDGYRDGSKVLSRRRWDRDFDGGFDNRRKEPDNRHREDRFCRSESFGFRKDVPKGYRSERERPKRDGSVSSWRRFGGREKEFGVDERERGGSLRLRDGEREKDRSVKSPSWSRDSGSEQSRKRAGVSGDLRDTRSSRSKSKSMASPTWSKDSGSEQSKSVGNVGKKSEEEVQGKCGSNSEMEEGELEPEPQHKAEMETVPSGDANDGIEKVEFDADHKEVEIKSNGGEVGKDVGSVVDAKENKSESSYREVECGDADKKVEARKKTEGSENAKEEKDISERDGELNVSNIKDYKNADDSGSEIGDRVCDETDKETGQKEDHNDMSKETSHVVLEEKVDLREDLSQDKGSCLAAKTEENEAPNFFKEAAERNVRAQTSKEIPDGLSQRCNKGKSVADVTDTSGDGVLTERPSIRGFDLFSNSRVKKFKKVERYGVDDEKDEKLALEPLDLSLSLPDVLLPVGGQDASVAPASPVYSRSARSLADSFCTNSDGFTMSMSFSGSQSFHHNPSCSLNYNSLDNCEQSVHSRPIFQNIDWQALSQNDVKNKENSLYQRLSTNGNGSVHQPQVSHGFCSSAQAGEVPLRIEGSSEMVNELERQLSFHRSNEARSPCPSTGSHENGSKYSFGSEKAKREMRGSSLYRSHGSKPGGDDFMQTVINQMVSDPMHVMAKKFNEMPRQYIGNLKESIREMMLNVGKRGQLNALQNALQNRTDITLDLLQKTHRALLEILVALRTRRPEFLLVDSNILSADLAEIFMNIRCKNLTCKSLLPVDECDCNVCAKKDGFCSACMCLVCSNFDMASNTCSWVGCDVCLHWCHTECGLRESYIRNGHSAARSNGITEMQFHCVACGHPSEMFGFVKEVFQNFAREWNLERFCKELEYVMRIFSASKDLRGERLYLLAEQILPRLLNKSVNLPDACNQLLAFLSGNVSISSGKEQNKPRPEVAGPSCDSSWIKSVFTDKLPSHVEKSSSLLHLFNNEQQAGKLSAEADFPRNSQKEPVFEELESIVRMKETEAKMFQARADDARREADGLKRIAVTKNNKIEEEYMNRIAKLRLGEAEDMRKRKYEELQAMERAQRDYISMKMRMEEDIRDLLLRMEATKRKISL